MGWDEVSQFSPGVDTGCGLAAEVLTVSGRGQNMPLGRSGLVDAPTFEKMEPLSQSNKISAGRPEAGESTVQTTRNRARHEMQSSEMPTTPPGDQKRLAVLIDAENAQPSVIEGLLAEVAKFGIAGVRRIYGDWTSPKHAQWKVSLLEHSITPIQQFAYTTGKNATDSALIIDAMDLMYSKQLDGFCLVSSDSDFTRLAQRLREAGMVVYGFGERKTPKPFVVACDKFIYTEVLRKEGLSTDEGIALTQPASGSTQAAPSATAARVGIGRTVTSIPPKPLASPIRLLAQAIEEGADESGWAHLGFVGSYLTKVQPDFDPRLYGCRKLSDLLKRFPGEFETTERGASGSPSKAIYVRANDTGDSAKRSG